MELYLLTVIKESEFQPTDHMSWIYQSFDSALAHYSTEVDAAREAHGYIDRREDEVATEHYRYYEIYNEYDVERTVVTIEKKILND